MSKKYFSNGDGTYQYCTGDRLNQSLYIKIRVPLRFRKLRFLLGMKEFNEIEIDCEPRSGFRGKFCVVSNSRRLIQSEITIT